MNYAKQFSDALRQYSNISKPSSDQRYSEANYHEKQSTTPKPSQDNKNPYEILGIRPNASLQEITAAYRKLAQENHPDKVSGLAEEFRQLAEQRMKIINVAYDELKRNFK